MIFFDTYGNKIPSNVYMDPPYLVDLREKDDTFISSSYSYMNFTEHINYFNVYSEKSTTTNVTSGPNLAFFGIKLRNIHI